MRRPDLATEERGKTRESFKPWIRRAQAALEELLMDWAAEEPGKPRNPRACRLEMWLGYFVMVIGGLVVGWAVGQHDISPAVVAVGGMLYFGGGCMAWRGASGWRKREPPLELGLAQEPLDNDPAK